MKIKHLGLVIWQIELKGFKKVYQGDRKSW